MDSALAESDSDFIVKSGHKVWFDLRENVVWKNLQATSVWKYAEWGVHAHQEIFPQWDDRFRYKEIGERKTMLMTTVSL